MLGPDVNSVILNKTFNITCSAKANPAAKYRLYKDQESFHNYTSGNEAVAVIITSVRERVLKVNYSCTPFNKFGDGPREEISLSVLCKYKYCDCYFFWHCAMYMNLCQLDTSVTVSLN